MSGVQEAIKALGGMKLVGILGAIASLFTLAPVGIIIGIWVAIWAHSIEQKLIEHIRLQDWQRSGLNDASDTTPPG